VAGRRVLITGVGSSVGTALALRLERDPRYEYVAGFDSRAPRTRLERTKYIEADIRDPAIATLIRRVAVDTIVHDQIVRHPDAGTSPQAMHDVNVIGSLQLLGALEKSDTIRAIVVRGSAGVYGAEPHAPQFFAEEMTRLFPLRTRFQRDVAEIETYFETFARRHPSVTCTMLRYQPAIGPGLETQVARYLGLPVVPTYLGFDPRLQFVHADDGLEALVAAIDRPVRGAVNVAGPGTIGLTRMARLAGRPTLPVPAPLFGSAIGAATRLGLPEFSEDFRRLLRHGRAVDTSRLVREIGFTPRYSTPEAVADFVGSLGRRVVPSIRQVVPL
jgi:UDP-glucose 4-epimerase